jgi:hypothetical protein
MNKRVLIGTAIGVAAGILSLEKANAETKTGNYTVPKNVKRIRVRSFVGDKEVLDTHFRVVPGQKFVIDAIEE